MTDKSEANKTPSKPCDMSLEEKPSRRESHSMMEHLRSILGDTTLTEVSSVLMSLPVGSVLVRANVPSGHVYVGSLINDTGTSVFSVEFIDTSH